MNIKAVIFDIDDTLTTKNSWNFVAVSLGVDGPRERENWQKYLRGEINEREVNANVLAMWKAKGLATKQEFAKIFDSMPLRSDAVDIVQYLNSKNIKICLITGSMDMYAEIIAAKLGVQDYYANARLYWNDKDELDYFDYDFDQAGLKLKQFRDFCRSNGFNPADCAVVGDSDNDRLLFLETKQGIAVRTPAEDKSLEKIAWRVVDNLSEIKDLIK